MAIQRTTARWRRSHALMERLAALQGREALAHFCLHKHLVYNQARSGMALCHSSHSRDRINPSWQLQALELKAFGAVAVTDGALVKQCMADFLKDGVCM